MGQNIFHDPSGQLSGPLVFFQHDQHLLSGFYFVAAGSVHRFMFLENHPGVFLRSNRFAAIIVSPFVYNPLSTAGQAGQK